MKSPCAVILNVVKNPPFCHSVQLAIWAQPKKRSSPLCHSEERSDVRISQGNTMNYLVAQFQIPHSTFRIPHSALRIPHSLAIIWNNFHNYRSKLLTNGKKYAKIVCGQERVGVNYALLSRLKTRHKIIFSYIGGTLLWQT